MKTLILGASGTLGSELARLFSRNGDVILQGRNRKRLLEVAATCSDPHTTNFICGDLFKTEVHQSIAGYVAGHGLDCAIFCAGDHHRGPFRHMGRLLQHDILNLNLTSVIGVTHKLLQTPSFDPKCTAGRVLVYINSVAGTVTSEDEAVYSASKYGLNGFVRALRAELRPSKIRVLQVFLGAMKGSWMSHRKDHDYLIEPADVAEIINYTVIHEHPSCQIEDITIGRFTFPAPVV